ncbi:hypothetical protein OVS_02065 [Mycoplasma ovis str. Michigan]|uniref:Uncharacterized protein n=1 Tax=Mycoplasma ovis str. Michigan TaxID=1415773 RepID=A0ABN4BLI8_9MOLU|nr:hypothetical protein [Mycoplasma ovis]AHC40275.1 hypothetical protein OVS_02065 [Mycoplasma ovis str. Michigan]
MFPKIFLNDELTRLTGQKFEINTETEQVENLRILNSQIQATFRGKELNETITGIWNEMDDSRELPNQRLASVTVEEAGKVSRQIYLILPPIENLDDETSS